MLGRKKALPIITSTPEGFSVDELLVTWAQIVSIRAYKLDLITYDLVCLGIELDGELKQLQISEEWPGFQALIDQLGSQFAFGAGWWSSVVWPPFKTNETLLYQRT